jgi:hypothetical protein
MKLGFVLPIFALTLSVACGTPGPGAASIKDDQGTVNDLPTPIMRCVETNDGAVVVDGRVELTIAKDQFRQLSARIVQRDQISGDSVMGDFVGVEEIDPASTFPAGIQNLPDLIYFAEDAQTTKHMTLSLWKNQATAGAFNGSLFLKAQSPYSERTVTLSCKR